MVLRPSQGATGSHFIANDRTASGSQSFSELILREEEQLTGLAKLSRTHSDQWSHAGPRVPRVGESKCNQLPRRRGKYLLWFGSMLTAPIR
jgi:hypothetical protein